MMARRGGLLPGKEAGTANREHLAGAREDDGLLLGGRDMENASASAAGRRPATTRRRRRGWGGGEGGAVDLGSILDKVWGREKGVVRRCVEGKRKGALVFVAVCAACAVG
jgi:hypothetical protein